MRSVRRREEAEDFRVFVSVSSVSDRETATSPLPSSTLRGREQEIEEEGCGREREVCGREGVVRGGGREEGRAFRLKEPSDLGVK